MMLDVDGAEVVETTSGLMSTLHSTADVGNASISSVPVLVSVFVTSLASENCAIDVKVTHAGPGLNATRSRSNHDLPSRYPTLKVLETT